MLCFFFQAEDGIRDVAVTGVQTCALPICPYLRGNVGFVNFSGSTTEVVGAYIDGTGAHERQIIEDLRPGGTKPMLGLAAGFTSPIGSGYQFRLELRDMMTAMERLSGPANDLAVAPSANRY